MENYRSAVLLGSTGLVGNYVLRHLMEDPLYHKVICLNRSMIEFRHPKFEQHIVDFEEPETWIEYIRGDDLFCCIGTTLRQAGSVEVFRKVDHDIPLRAAQAASVNGIKEFLFVSSIGANPESSNYYLKAKGEVEHELKLLEFGAIHIFRPSFLLGPRKSLRVGEWLMKNIAAFISPLLAGGLKKYRPIPAEQVAKAMIMKAKDIQHGVHIYHYEEMMASTSLPFKH